MAQTKINNNTACEHQVLFANDENFRPLLTAIVKATFDITLEGKLKFSAEQIPVNLEGKFVDNPETSSYIYEPETAFTKNSTDVVVLGDAMSTKGPCTHLLIDIVVGALHKKLGIIGDRFWVKQAVGYAISDITPFETMPLIYENAFGGWDKRHEQAELQGFEPRNTVGKGYYRSDVDHVDAPMPLPNIEDPNHLIQSIKDKPAPVGSGFTLPHWQPRATLAGTYDETWVNSRSPLLPVDFNRQYFNAASPGLISPSYLQGNEAVSISNMTPNGLLKFFLPNAKPPECKVELKDRYETLPTLLDTVIINTKTLQLQLIWRNFLSLDNGPHDVEVVDINYA